MRILKPGCEYYTNLLYPVVVKGKMFRITRVVRSNGEIMDIEDRDLFLWKHYPLCKRCVYPSLELLEFCQVNTVSPCGKHYDANCRPFTDQTLALHLIECRAIPCRKLAHFLKMDAQVVTNNWLLTSV